MDFRKAVESDIKSIMNIIKHAQTYFKEHGINQWQDNYPNLEIVRNDIVNKNGFVLLTDDNIIDSTK